MNNNFLQAVDFTLSDAIEGGYVNNPSDPGGETNFGISKRSYPNINIKALTKEDALDIYHRDYWLKSHCEDMPFSIALSVFDMAVNSGIGNALKTLQKALKTEPDGIYGAQTKRLLIQADERELFYDFNAERLRFLVNNINFSKFGRGWLERVVRLVDYAF